MIWPRLHTEQHAFERLSWLRAVVLGANDGLLSTSSLILGVASAHGAHASILVAGMSGLVAGAMSMAAGEYVSVSSQSDSERADIARERKELSANRDGELAELAEIYEKRGLDAALAGQVAEQLMARDALAAHTRDELGISQATAARPVVAALASAAAFSVGAALPLLIAVVSPMARLFWTVSLGSLLSLSVLGMVGAMLGGADPKRAAFRVTFWGALAMAVTAGIGTISGIRP